MLKKLVVASTLAFLFSCSSTPEGSGNNGQGYSGYLTKSYKVRGRQYTPMSVDEALRFSQTGIASYYDESAVFGMVSGKTAIGERVHPWHIHAAHTTLPLPCKVLVTSLTNGKRVLVRVNDRGPFVKGRIIDLSRKAAEELGMIGHGTMPVRIDVISVGDGPWKRYRQMPPRKAKS